MKKLKLFIISVCFRIADRLMDENHIAEPDPAMETLVKELVKDVRIPQIDLYHPACFGSVYESFHDCEPCPVFNSCETKALVENL